jgi:hypothetical protein
MYEKSTPQDEMGSALWDYIKTNTYVTHDDPWFWKKLRYALPHRGGWRARRPSYKFGAVTILRRRHDTDQVPTLWISISTKCYRAIRF